MGPEIIKKRIASPKPAVRIQGEAVPTRRAGENTAGGRVPEIRQRDRSRRLISIQQIRAHSSEFPGEPVESGFRPRNRRVESEIDVPDAPLGKPGDRGGKPIHRSRPEDAVDGEGDFRIAGQRFEEGGEKGKAPRPAALLLGQTVEAQRQGEPMLIQKREDIPIEKRAVRGQGITKTLPGIPADFLRPADRPADQIEGKERLSAVKLNHRRCGKKRRNRGQGVVKDFVFKGF